MEKLMMIGLSLSGGGAERVLSILANSVADRGYEVHVLILIKKEREYHLSSKVIRHQLGQSDYDNKIKRLNFIRKTIKVVGPCAVMPFLYEPTLYSYIASIGLRHKYTYIATVRNNPQHYPKTWFQKVLTTWMTIHSDVCMLQTEEQAKYFKWKKQKPYFVVPNPVDQKFLRKNKIYSSEIKNIVAMGRLVPQKNYPVMIRAFGMALKNNPQMRLDIYGEGPDRVKLQQYINALGYDNNIFLRGRTDDGPNILEKADLYIMTSDYEGFPNALMEAMAVGLPCISTACETGVKDLIVDHVNGYLVEVGNAEALADKINMCCEWYQECVKVGMHAKAEIENNYTQNAVTRKLIAALHDIME